MKPFRANYLSTGQVGELCEVSNRTVINWIERGLLRAHQLPGRGDNRVAVVDLMNFLRENNMPVPQALLPPVKKNVALVVDDDEMTARGILRHLRRLGFITGLAYNGFDAGVAYATLKPTLITLDLQMPRLDGFELLQQLRDRENCKVLVISGAGEESLEKARAAGADAALAKPFDPLEFERLIKSFSVAVNGTN